nr:hypothetical protein HUO10_005530 [Paraburkholderia busanensis]
MPVRGETNRTQSAARGQSAGARRARQAGGERERRYKMPLTRHAAAMQPPAGL